ncbi:MAG: efflux RND transporter periplasmic adaptor subunit [Gemmatimonadetes bacterium]|nr:efflux RND transporter periplasmic adaptor subunit [Gemmatimonadota bacterium]
MITIRRMAGAIALGATVLAAGFAAWRWGRTDPATDHSGHDMATMQAGGLAADPVVTLAAADQRLIGVTFAPADTVSLARQIRLVGIVGYDESRLSTVTTRVEGFVERLGVDFTGRSVQAGEVLLELYAPEVVAAQEELILAQRLLRELDSASAEARLNAAAMVDAAQRRLAAWAVPADVIAAVASGGQVRRTFPLRSTATGFAVEKSVTAGQRIMPGDPLYRLADLRIVWIEGDVYERDLADIRLGAPVVARFTALPGVARRGTVAYLYPSVSAATRTARVRVSLPNTDLTLKPGMYATLELARFARAALTIPRSAALVTGARTLVFLKRPDGRFEPREVTLGGSDDTRYEVIAGLALGDTVVASGTFLLDAESNLGTMLGGMGGMPGMDMTPAGTAHPARDSHPTTPRR